MTSSYLLMMDFETVWNLRVTHLIIPESFLDWLLYQYNIPHIPTLLTKIFVWFVSLEFKWLWLVAGNGYLQRDGVGEVLDEDGGLNVKGLGVTNCIKCLQRGWIGVGSFTKGGGWRFKKGAHVG